MAYSTQDHPYHRLVAKFEPQSRLLKTWQLTGGVSAQVTALEILRPNGQTQNWVVRRHGPVDRAQNPHIAAQEFNLLQILHSAGLPVPTPCYLDTSGQIFPIPYLVIEYIPGRPEFDPTDLPALLRQMAAALAKIHSLDITRLGLSTLPSPTPLLGERSTILDDSLHEGRLRAVLEPAWPLPVRNKPVLLHADFWPGNLLWQGDRLAAVIDWEDAHIGEPLADLANTRLETLWAFGVEAMQAFTHQYLSLAPCDTNNLPYWDLYAALKPISRISQWAQDPAEENSFRAGHRLFTAQAFQQLSFKNNRPNFSDDR